MLTTDVLKDKNFAPLNSSARGVTNDTQPASVYSKFLRPDQTLKLCYNNSMPIEDNEEKGKMFVGGLSLETTQDTLQRYFSRYGEVIDCVVMKNPDTGRSRGFGFVTFSDPENVDVVLTTGPHNLDGRTIDPKPCNPRSMQQKSKNVNYPKVFLGGLPSNVTETMLKSFFSRYGQVMEVVIMYDQDKKKSRGFGFLSFDSEESVDRCVSEHYVNINGKQVEIKRAEPRDMIKGDGPGMGDHSHWGGPGPMGMGGGMGPGPGGMGPPNGPGMGPMSSGPMGNGIPPQGMQGGYQSWGHQGGYPPQGYGPGGPQNYQGWGQQMPQQQQMGQWGNYGGPPTQGYGYSDYGGPQGGGQGFGNWNWGMNSNSPGGPQGASQGGMGPPGPSPPNMGPPQGPSPPKSSGSQDYSGYGNQYGHMGGYPQENNYGPGRGYSQPPQPGYMGYGGGQGDAPVGGAPAPGYGGPGGMTGPPVGPGGPGPQRGGSYNQPTQTQGFHPYRR